MSDVVGALAGFIAVLVGAWLLFAAGLWIHRPSRDRAAATLKLLPELARLAYRLALDTDTPRRYRLGLLALGLYLASPLDLIPDILPAIGALDDVILTGLVLRWVGRGVGRARIERHWTGSPEGLAALQDMLGTR